MALTPIQQEFAEFLASLWRNNNENIAPLTILGDGCSGVLIGDVLHQYKITKHQSWKIWKTGSAKGTVSQGSNFDAKRKTHWWCQSLSEAASHYSWTGNAFSGLAVTLQTAMSAGNQTDAANACRNIFLWGGVAKKPKDRSRLWVDHNEKATTLISEIQRAVGLLKPGSINPLTPFCKTGLLMNSAMTKVYAAVDPSIIIYDGRVGAALGLMTRLFLAKKGVSCVPTDLAFLWGPNQTDKTIPNSRNPSHGPYKFKSLYDPSIGDFDRAGIARIAGEILGETRRILNFGGAVITMHELEKAFFMVGYKVR